MWLVISEPEDSPALWAYSKLREAGLDPIEQITPAEFSYAARSNYTLNSENSEFEFNLRDGRTVRSDEIQGILNRLTIVPTQHLGYSPDTQYAIQEFNAFFLGWLSSIDAPVINYPSPLGLSGKWRHLVEWTWLANISGLPTIRLCHGSMSSNKDISYSQNDDRVMAIVAGGEVFGEDLPESIVNGCITLAERSNTSLLAIMLSYVRGDLIFVNANPFPDLQLGGERIIKKIKEILVDGDYQ